MACPKKKCQTCGQDVMPTTSDRLFHMISTGACKINYNGWSEYYDPQAGSIGIVKDFNPRYADADPVVIYGSPGWEIEDELLVEPGFIVQCEHRGGDGDEIVHLPPFTLPDTPTYRNGVLWDGWSKGILRMARIFDRLEKSLRCPS